MVLFEVLKDDGTEYDSTLGFSVDWLQERFEDDSVSLQDLKDAVAKTAKESGESLPAAAVTPKGKDNGDTRSLLEGFKRATAKPQLALNLAASRFRVPNTQTPNLSRSTTPSRFPSTNTATTTTATTNSKERSNTVETRRSQTWEYSLPPDLEMVDKVTQKARLFAMERMLARKKACWLAENMGSVVAKVVGRDISEEIEEVDEEKESSEENEEEEESDPELPGELTFSHCERMNVMTELIMAEADIESSKVASPIRSPTPALFLPGLDSPSPVLATLELTKEEEEETAEPPPKEFQPEPTPVEKPFIPHPDPFLARKLKYRFSPPTASLLQYSPRTIVDNIRLYPTEDVYLRPLYVPDIDVGRLVTCRWPPTGYPAPEWNDGMVADFERNFAKFFGAFYPVVSRFRTDNSSRLSFPLSLNR